MSTNKKQYQLKKVKCYYTGFEIDKHLNINNDEELIKKANHIFSWSKEHLISKNSNLYSELSLKLKEKNVVDSCRIVNNSLNDSPLYIKLLVKHKFKNISDKSSEEVIKEQILKIIQDTCIEYDYYRGKPYKNNPAYHKEIDILISSHIFKHNFGECDFSKIPNNIINKIKKEEAFKEFIHIPKVYNFKLFGFKFSIKISK